MKRRIFCFWTDNAKMSRHRRACLDSIVRNSGCGVELVTPENLGGFILKEHPLHEAYRFLHAAHKADYLRCYFLHHHGGGYTDIKQTDCDWNPCFDALENDENLWGAGYRLLEPGAAVALHGGDEMKARRNWKSLIGGGAFIFKPGTPFTSEWYRQLLEIMDEHSQALRKHPARRRQYRYELLKMSTSRRARLWTMLHPGHSGYPLRWVQILGEIFHPLCLKHADRLSQELPAPDFGAPWR